MVKDLEQTTKQRKQSSIEYTMISTWKNISRNEVCTSNAGITEYMNITRQCNITLFVCCRIPLSRQDQREWEQHL